MKICSECNKERANEINVCECGNTYVMNTPNAVRLFEALKRI